jgi:hypothetical protein
MVIYLKKMYHVQCTYYHCFIMWLYRLQNKFRNIVSMSIIFKVIHNPYWSVIMRLCDVFKCIKIYFVKWMKYLSILRNAVTDITL